MVKTHEINLNIELFNSFTNRNYIILDNSKLNIQKNDYILFRQTISAKGEEVWAVWPPLAYNLCPCDGISATVNLCLYSPPVLLDVKDIPLIMQSYAKNRRLLKVVKD